MAVESAGGVPPGHGDLPVLDTSVAHPARVYDYWLGGKDNFAADRRAAEAGLEAFPHTVLSVRANRAFLARAVTYLVTEAGIRQFLDIGTGLPAADNTHEVAQAIAPACRVAYVDNDPVVLAHAHALLTSAAEGATAYIDADLRDPAAIVREAAAVLDFSAPVAIMLLGILHFVHDDEHPRQIVDALLGAVPTGSYLVLSHLASDLYPEQIAAFAGAMNKQVTVDVQLRGKAEVARFFRGLPMIEPGLVQVAKWRPRSDVEAAAPAALWGGIGRKQAPARVPLARNPAS